MFGRHLFRSLRSALGHGNGLGATGRRPGIPNNGPQPQHRFGRLNLNRFVASAAAGNGLVQLLARGPHIYKLGTAAIVSGGAVTVYTTSHAAPGTEDMETSQIGWVQELADREGMREVLIPGQMLRKHPLGQLVSEEDHLFETMRRSEQIKEFRCFYDPNGKKFYSVVMLGKEVCGYPFTVHGGLTAAIIDETLGGLYTALLTSGKLGMQLPGLTARLEVDYKKKIPAGTVLLVTTEVEQVQPRKVWMKASVCNGEGNTFATGRALFVAPNIGKHFSKLLVWKDNMQGQLQQQVAVAGAVAGT